MINKSLISPQSIVIVGGSNHLNKPGGKIVKNIIDGNYAGELFIVNPKENQVQGQVCFHQVAQLPEVELAILVIPASGCVEAVKILTKEKNCRAFIVISAGFGEAGVVGQHLEKQMVDLVNEVDGCLIGPNCIGIINQNYKGVFTSPIPQFYANGCDLISGSGATAVFFMEAGISNGLRFSNIFSVGNSAQTRVEDVLQYLDETYEHGKSAPIKLLYLESINDANKLCKHASSLINKGARIAGIKAGSTSAGSRAAASHTGAIVSSEMAVRALFRKVGIVYCTSRDELITVASVFSYKELHGKRIAIITHAGGSAVMLTDALSKGGLEIPPLEGPSAEGLLSFLHPGSSVGNPIDFLATGTAEQLGIIIDYCEHKFTEIDAMIVVFGSSGLFDVANVYDVIRAKLDICSKPIFPVLPSIINAQKEISSFLSKGNVNFPDEVLLGKALSVVYNTQPPMVSTLFKAPKRNAQLEKIFNEAGNQFLSESDCATVLSLSHINLANQKLVNNQASLIKAGHEVGFPLVAKVSGPLHKSDVKGVLLNIQNDAELQKAFEQLMKIDGAKAVLIQKMHHGLELFIGVSHEKGFGHILLFGLGGIFVEVFKDVKGCLLPVEELEVRQMLEKLQSYPLLEGIRGSNGIDIDKFVQIILRVSDLIMTYPEIVELDINPLLANADEIIAVDMRIRIEQN